MRRVPTLSGSYLVLETTNACSLACVHCSVSEAGHPHHLATGYLPPELCERLFTELIAMGARFDALILFWLGEPLIHPHFAEIYRSALRAGVEGGVFGKVEVHTNATHLSADKVRTALNAAPLPQVWHFSLDAATRHTYRRVKGADRFQTVESNIDGFLDARAARAARWPRPVFQFIVSSNNVAEVPAFRNRWEDACRRRGIAVRTVAQNVPAGDDAVVFFRQLDAPDPATQEKENAVFREAMRKEGLDLPRPLQTPLAVAGENVAVCGCFWKSPVVGWDGRVTTCTRDNRMGNAIGSLWDRSFEELWWGERMRARRAGVARGDYGDLAPCADCFIPKSANYSDITAPEIEAHG